MKTLPERLEATLVSEGASESTGAKRQIWQSKEFGVTIVVTWAPPYPDVGIMQFTCKNLPLASFNTYEKLRKAHDMKREVQA